MDFDGKKLFGTDGIRGHANVFPMTVEIALAIGKATAMLLHQKKVGKSRVVIGKDTRISCYMFENALVAGLCSMGVDTLMVGPLPTPGIAFITRAYRAAAGIVVSASHNRYYDNGIKIFDHEGYKLSDHLEEDVEAIIKNQSFIKHIPQDPLIGKNKRVSDVDGRYIEFIKATFPKGKTLKNMKIVLDCANGAAHRVAPLVFEELDAELFTYANNPDGLNINENCGSLHPEYVQKKVLEHKANVGIALDGDADRVILVDEKGNIIDGDTILAIVASYLKKHNVLKNDIVVATVMSNLGVIKFLENQGIKVLLSKVGDRYVIEDMRNQNAILGGEQSGHLIFLEHNTTGDGIVSALQVLKIIEEEQVPLSKLAASVVKFPQVVLNVPVKSKVPLENLPNIQKSIKEAEQSLNDQGRLLIRYSGTENVCRVLVEGSDYKLIERLAKNIADEIKNSIG